MLVARRPMSIGSVVFNTGDRITREAQDQLPPGRMPQLISHGWVEELVDEVALERRVENLEAQVDDLRAQIVRLSTGGKAATKRQRKEAEEEVTPAEAPPEEEAPPEAPPEEAPAEDPAEVEPEPESPAETEPMPEEAPAKVWDPIDAAWKSEDELIAATEARAKQRRRTKVVK